MKKASITEAKTGGRNLRMDFRYAGDDINRIRALAQELASIETSLPGNPNRL
jgi:hypothetical protein